MHELLRPCHNSFVIAQSGIKWNSPWGIIEEMLLKHERGGGGGGGGGGGERERDLD